MLNLPKSTDVNRLIPKDKLIKKLSLTPALKTSLKDNVKKVIVTNELSNKSMNIVRGNDVWAVFVVEMQLKQKEADYKLIEALGKQIGQKIVFVLRYEEAGQLAIYRSNRLYYSEWTNFSELTFEISGDNFDSVWDGIIGQIALENDNTVINTESSIEEMLERQNIRKKLERKIAALEKKIKKETQLNLQAKMKKELTKLKEKLT